MMKQIDAEVPRFMCQHCGRNYAKNGAPSISLEALLKESTGLIPCGITIDVFGSLLGEQLQWRRGDDQP